jgi:hypothetical protein
MLFQEGIETIRGCTRATRLEVLESLKRTPRLLNTPRKEGFARVHRKRKGDALICSNRLREKSSKSLVECKECIDETVSPPYKLRRESEKLPGGTRKSTEGHRGT